MRQLIHAAILFILLSVTGCVTTQPVKQGAAKETVHETLYDRIVIEVQAIKNVEPARHTFKILAELFEKYKFCKKENLLVVYKYPIEDHNIFLWLNHDVHMFEHLYKAILDKNPLDRDFSVFVSYLPGVYNEPKLQTVAGLQYRWSSIAVFGNYSGKAGANLLLHEFGHLIGMVRNRTGKPANPKRIHHCNDKKCVMYWQWNKKNGLCNICEQDVLKILSLKNENPKGPH